MYPRTRTSSCGRVQHYPHAVWHRAFKTHDSSNGITCSVPTATRPSPESALTLGFHELRGGTHLLLCPYQSGSQTSRLLVQLWYPVYDRVESVKDTEDVGWIGVVAASIAFAAGASADVPDTVGPIVATDNFSKTIEASSSTSFPYLQGSVDVKASGGDSPTQGFGVTKLNSLGAKYVRFYFDENGEDFRAGSSDMNVLFAEI